MARLRAFGIALIAIAAPRALSQEAAKEPAAVARAPAEVPAARAAPQDVSLEIGGIRARIVLNRGSSLDGLLPLGTQFWEKPSDFCEYQEADASDSGAGLRLYFVLGMEGAIFIRRSDIATVKDLGAISDEAAAAIRQGLLDSRRKALAEKEARLKEVLLRIQAAEGTVEEPRAAPPPAAPTQEPPGPSVPPAAPPTEAPVPATTSTAPKAAAPAPAPGRGGAPLAAWEKEEAEKAKAEARRARGDELLRQYPPPDWSERRLETILWRERVAKIPPDQVEAPFVKESDLWVEALRRREAAERKASAPVPSGKEGAAEALPPASR